MRGRAAEVVQARRQRRWNESQSRIALYIFPINLIAIGICIYCANIVSSVERDLATGTSKGLFLAGVFMQSYWCYIVMRDTVLTVSHFAKGHRQAFAAVIALHYLMSCLDNLLLTGLMIWGTVEINSSGADDFAKADESTGLPLFLKVTILNIVMAYIYVCSHVCAFPIGLCIIARNPEQYGMRRAEDLNDDELDMLGDSHYAE